MALRDVRLQAMLKQDAVDEKLRICEKTLAELDLGMLQI